MDFPAEADKLKAALEGQLKALSNSEEKLEKLVVKLNQIDSSAVDSVSATKIGFLN